MSNTSRYTILIFFGVLIALVVMFSLTSVFTPSAKKKGPQSVTSTPAQQAAQASPVDGSVSPSQSTIVGNQVLEKVKNEVHTITSVSVDQIQVVSQESATWSSSALGCPKPGFTYVFVTIPGYRIIMKVGDEIFEYHTDLANTIELCSDTRGS